MPASRMALLDVSGCCICMLGAEWASRIQYVIVLEIPKRLADL